MLQEKKLKYAYKNKEKKLTSFTPLIKYINFGQNSSRKYYILYNRPFK